jgi:hypothetical protein
MTHRISTCMDYRYASVRMLRSGAPDQGDAYGHVYKIRAFRWRWQLVAGGTVLAQGYALTHDGAWTKAVFAANGIGGAR